MIWVGVSGFLYVCMYTHTYDIYKSDSYVHM